MKIVDKLVEISKNPPSQKNLFVARVLPIIVFFFIFPALLFIIPSLVFDKLLHWPTFTSYSLRIIPGVALILFGIYFLAESTLAQRKIGKGTPMPMKATNKLVIEKPYSYCRNPLYFGLITFYIGISILLGSTGSLMMVILFSLLIFAYIKFIEEKELERRFGLEYLEYKKNTPSFIPSFLIFWRNKK